jgi:hypothetical protein
VLIKEYQYLALTRLPSTGSAVNRSSFVDAGLTEPCVFLLRPHANLPHPAQVQLNKNRRDMMTNTLAFVATNQQSTKLEMIVVSWVHNTANSRYIEISATNSTVG